MILPDRKYDLPLRGYRKKRCNVHGTGNSLVHSSLKDQALGTEAKKRQAEIYGRRRIVASSSVGSTTKAGNGAGRSSCLYRA